MKTNDTLISTFLKRNLFKNIHNVFALMCLLIKNACLRLHACTWVYSRVRLLCVPAVQDTVTLDAYSTNNGSDAAEG